MSEDHQMDQRHLLRLGCCGGPFELGDPIGSLTATYSVELEDRWKVLRWSCYRFSNEAEMRGLSELPLFYY